MLYIFPGRSMLGFSLTSPDLVICAGSPDIPTTNCGDSPEFSDRNKELSPESSLELLLEPAKEEKFPKNRLSVVSINAGSTDGTAVLDGVEFLEDNCFSGGDTVRTNATIGDGQEHGLSLYQTLVGNFSYCFSGLEPGNYAVSLHFAEIVFTDGPPGMRVFDVFIQQKKELQNELMRKSMHVGSLAFAIEGQVKEKSSWFSSLRDMTRKLKLMKMDHIKLSEEALAYKKCLADMDEMRSTIQSTSRKHKGLCRCRPLNAEELSLGASMTIDFESAKDTDVFEGTAPFATSVLDGYNACIFAYGQTGTGKTFTMEGTEEARGVNFRILEEIFRIIKERHKLFRYEVSVSVLEVYNEQIRDLLGSVSQPGMAAKRLEIRQVGEGLHHVPGLVEAHVNSISEAWEVLQTGSNARAVGSTNANEQSSRSHWNSKLTHLLQDSLGEGAGVTTAN
ncbi:hypothetical protein GH714_011494 [Hevea brasiliensis]|uniref:Kinesin motor domain-containing protein n=1 Tax=Hevea brasiliensis TaxID=3981 RepID=A0A6A6KBM3_HEVBR|nr:hypothetical protein GH714_011494 [Hevea brasiliensis]